MKARLVELRQQRQTQQRSLIPTLLTQLHQECPSEEVSMLTLPPVIPVTKISCMMITYRRLTCVERSLTWFLSQEIPPLGVETELIVFNTDRDASLSLDASLDELQHQRRIHIVNQSVDLITGNPYQDLGSIRRDAMTYATGSHIMIWDDDDIFFPWHIWQAVEGIRQSQMLAWTPRPAFIQYSHDAEPFLSYDHSIEVSTLVQRDALQVLGFALATATEHHLWYSGLLDQHMLILDELSIPSYCFYWGDLPTVGGHKLSDMSEFVREDNFQRHMTLTSDIADRPIRKTRLREYVEMCQPFLPLLETFRHTQPERFEIYVEPFLQKMTVLSRSSTSLSSFFGQESRQAPQTTPPPSPIITTSTIMPPSPITEENQQIPSQQHGVRNTPEYGFLLTDLADDFVHHVTTSSHFTSEECQRIIEMGCAVPAMDATIGNFTVDTGIRKSRVHWVPFQAEYRWIWERLETLVHQANTAHWHFALIGCLEQLQFTEYHSPGGNYNWHMDYGKGAISKRKISVTVQLSDPSTYEGGDLELFYAVTPFTAPRDQGSVCLFPSYTMHRVTPMISGIRYSLVVWISGPNSYR